MQCRKKNPAIHYRRTSTNNKVKAISIAHNRVTSKVEPIIHVQVGLHKTIVITETRTSDTWPRFGNGHDTLDIAMLVYVSRWFSGHRV